MAEKWGTENLGDMLFREGLISNAQLEEADKRQKESGKFIGQILVEMGAVTEGVKMSFLRKKLGYDYISLENKQIDPLCLTYIPKSFAEKFHLVPVKMENRTLVVAMDDPSDLSVMDNLKAIVGVPIKPVISTSADIDAALKQYPEQEEEKQAVRRAASPLIKIIRRLVFFFFAFGLPIILVIILYQKSEVFKEFMRPITHEGGSFSFDVFFYTMLGGSLWIIIVYEINSLVFEKSGKEIPEPLPAEEPFKE
ncbi:MAG: bacteriophage N4 adsorption protein B [candidate division BRC1 bacterium ADurb.Bin183]|nr:MAG: bacteriophage N4 adsorption protein B [candidate division BRC1 bacterium ADurb.Bin183]